MIFTTNDAYDVTYRGAKPLTEQQIQQFRDTTLHDVFYILRERLAEPGFEFEGSGADFVENQPAEMMDFFDSENRKVRVWVNSDTFLPVKQSFYSLGPDHQRPPRGSHALLEIPGRRKQRMWPYVIERERDTEKIFVLYSDHVSVDDALPDSMFELPNGIKMLSRSK